MLTPPQLKAVTDALEALDEVRSGGTGQAAWWRRIALAAEGIAGAGTTANATLTGYMKRTAVALESISGTSGAEENTTETGYLKRTRGVDVAGNAIWGIDQGLRFGDPVGAHLPLPDWAEAGAQDCLVYNNEFYTRGACVAFYDAKDCSAGEDVNAMHTVGVGGGEPIAPVKVV